MSRNPHLLQPRVILPHIHDITPDFLESHGLKGLLLDLDNTLIPYGSYDERADVLHWAKELQAAGYALYLLSNATRERARVWAERLGLPGVGLAGKPFAQGYRRGLSAVGLPAHQVGMVGDQLFTDVLGGNWSGMFTIMVRPISDNALPHTRLTRRLERFVLKRYGHDWAGKAGAGQIGAGKVAPAQLPDLLLDTEPGNDWTDSPLQAVAEAPEASTGASTGASTLSEQQAKTDTTTMNTELHQKGRQD